MTFSQPRHNGRTRPTSNCGRTTETVTVISFKSFRILVHCRQFYRMRGKTEKHCRVLSRLYETLKFGQFVKCAVLSQLRKSYQFSFYCSEIISVQFQYLYLRHFNYSFVIDNCRTVFICSAYRHKRSTDMHSATFDSNAANCLQCRVNCCNVRFLVAVL